MVELLIIFLLILLNGVFAMAEIAMVASRRSRLQSSAKKGDKAAGKALELSGDMNRFLATAQIGITLIGILTGVYSGDRLGDYLENLLNGVEWARDYSDTLSVTIIVVLLTFLSLVLGELVPKRIGLSMPETMARLLAYPMYWVSVLVSPFIWLLTVTSDFLIRVFRIRKTEERNITEEEIKSIIKEATQTGEVQLIEQGLVENVFHLGNRKINSLMTPRSAIVWLDCNSKEEEMRSIIASSVHKSFPVANNSLDHIRGIVYSKELLNELLNNHKLAVNSLLKPALFLTESTLAYQALEQFSVSQQHVAIVVNEYGGVEGLLTMNDLVEALVGDFVKQLHDKKKIVPLEDGSFEVNADLSLPEFIRYFNVEAPENENLGHMHTLNGLVLRHKGEVPNVGYAFTWAGLRLEVTEMDKNRVSKILVSRDDAADAVS